MTETGTSQPVFGIPAILSGRWWYGDQGEHLRAVVGRIGVRHVACNARVRAIRGIGGR